MSAKNLSTVSPLLAHAAKRALIDNLESCRHPNPRRAETTASKIVNCRDWQKSELIAEVERLRAEIAEAHAQDCIYNESLREMEDKALAAISEAGAIKARWQEQQATTVCNRPAAEENARLALQLRSKQEENLLLTQALCESENEIARLTRALAVAVEKIAG